MFHRCYLSPLTYPLPRSSFAKGYFRINYHAKSSHRILPSLGPYLAVSRVTRVRTMSPCAASLRIPSSKASCVSSLQNSGSCILSIDLEGVVETLASDPGDEGPGESKGGLTVGDGDGDTPSGRHGSGSWTACFKMKKSHYIQCHISRLQHIRTLDIGINFIFFCQANRWHYFTHSRCRQTHKLLPIYIVFCQEIKIPWVSLNNGVDKC